MRLKYKVGTRVRCAEEPRRIGVVLGKCEHGFYLIGHSRSYEGHSGHGIEVGKYAGRCCWAKANQITAV